MDKKEFLDQAKANYEAKVKGSTKGIDWTAEMNFIYSEKLILRVWFDVQENVLLHKWNTVDTLPIKEQQKIKRALGHYTSNDDEDYSNIIKNLKKALKEHPDGMVDYVDGLVMWEKVEMEFTVRQFCELIGLNSD